MTALRTTISIFIAALLNLGIWYLWLPPMNLLAPSFWCFLIIAILIIAAALAFAGYDEEFYTPATIAVIVAIVCLAILIIGSLFGCSFFNAKMHSNLLEVQDTIFILIF